MPQTPSQQRAADTVAKWLAANEKNPAWLVDATGADPGTIGDFLNGLRWPKLGTQGKIEKALGWPSGCIRQIGNGSDPEVVGAVVQDPGYVAAPGDRSSEGSTDDEVLREVRAMRGEVRELSERVARLESRPEPLGSSRSST